MTKNPARQILSPTEAARAIYIDFEGNKNKPPVLLGSLYFEGRKTPDPRRMVLRHDVLDSRFHRLDCDVRAADLHRYEHEARTLHWAMADVVRRAKAQQRPIVSWSQHEALKVAEGHLSEADLADFAAHYRDGKETAKAWAKQTQSELGLRQGEHTLVRYFDLVGYRPGAGYAEVAVGSTLAALTRMLDKGRDWDALTQVRRDSWTNLLAYNFHDCNGLRAVVQRAAAGLAEAHR